MVYARRTVRPTCRPLPCKARSGQEGAETFYFGVDKFGLGANALVGVIRGRLAFAIILKKTKASLLQGFEADHSGPRAKLVYVCARRFKVMYLTRSMCELIYKPVAKIAKPEPRALVAEKVCKLAKGVGVEKAYGLGRINVMRLVLCAIGEMRVGSRRFRHGVRMLPL